MPACHEVLFFENTIPQAAKVISVATGLVPSRRVSKPVGLLLMIERNNISLLYLSNFRLEYKTIKPGYGAKANESVVHLSKQAPAEDLYK